MLALYLGLKRVSALLFVLLAKLATQCIRWSLIHGYVRIGKQDFLGLVGSLCQGETGGRKFRSCVHAGIFQVGYYSFE